eukprot:scaffold603899_cov19-Prasinocladus_malaysianus.AAC.1
MPTFQTSDSIRLFVLLDEDRVTTEALKDATSITCLTKIILLQGRAADYAVVLSVGVRQCAAIQ